MGKQENFDSDHEYKIMAEIAVNDKVSQRDLSRQLGLSVSTVNILIKKMIKEGLIKMNQVTTKQVLYMLTPEGMNIKAKKTVNYIKRHYDIINENKIKIRNLLNDLKVDNDVIYILIDDYQIKDIITTVVSEIKSNKVVFINSFTEINQEETNKVLIYLSTSDCELEEYEKIKGLRLIDIAQVL